MAIQLHVATLGGGCFWCLDAVYRRVRGVESSICGYAGGNDPSPTYEHVSSGSTGHAEVVQLTLDPTIIDYPTILDIFWTIHDPTTTDQQGNDIGSQYRSIILFHNETQRQQAIASQADTQQLWDRPIVTQIVPLTAFYPAEAYHQDYFESHPEQAYCQVVINPKLHKLQQKFAKLLR